MSQRCRMYDVDPADGHERRCIFGSVARFEQIGPVCRRHRAMVRMENAENEYGAEAPLEHEDDCPRWLYPDRGCACGLDELPAPDKLCADAGHRAAYRCARCGRAHCCDCDLASDVAEVKTVVRYCPDWRCQRERKLELEGGGR